LPAGIPTQQLHSIVELSLSVIQSSEQRQFVFLQLETGQFECGKTVAHTGTLAADCVKCGSQSLARLLSLRALTHFVARLLSSRKIQVTLLRPAEHLSPASIWELPELVELVELVADLTISSTRQALALCKFVPQWTERQTCTTKTTNFVQLCPTLWLKKSTWCVQHQSLAEFLAIFWRLCGHFVQNSFAPVALFAATRARLNIILASSSQARPLLLFLLDNKAFALYSRQSALGAWVWALFPSLALGEFGKELENIERKLKIAEKSRKIGTNMGKKVPNLAPKFQT